MGKPGPSGSPTGLRRINLRFRVHLLCWELATVTEADALEAVAHACHRAPAETVRVRSARQADVLAVVGRESHVDDALVALSDAPAQALVVRVDEFDVYQLGSLLKVLNGRRYAHLLLSTQLPSLDEDPPLSQAERGAQEALRAKFAEVGTEPVYANPWIQVNVDGREQRVETLGLLRQMGAKMVGVNYWRLPAIEHAEHSDAAPAA